MMKDPGRVRRFSPRFAAVSAVAVAIVLGASACASGGGGTPSTSGAAGDASQYVDAAKKVIADAETQPTKIAVSKPVGAAIPKGKTIGLIACGTAGCQGNEVIIRTATDKLGWTLKTYSTDGSPQGNQTAFESAVRDKPDAIMYIALPKEQIVKYLQQAKDAGIAVVASAVVDKPDDLLLYTNYGNDTYKSMGSLLADWTIQQSEGKGKAVYFGFSPGDFPILQPQVDGFNSTLKDHCPGCDLSVDMQLIPLADFANATQLQVSYLRAHPDVKTVVDQQGIGTGVPAALKAAGITDVTTLTGFGDDTTLQYVKAGQVSGNIMTDYWGSMYGMVDALVRNFAKVDQVPGGDFPLWIVDQKTAPDVSNGVPEVTVDTKGQFFKLWGIK
jgi:ribose transport system substrate-binding protein